MNLGRSFHETIVERLRKDAEYREESLNAAADCLKDGENNVAKAMLCDQIYATIGFEKLASLMGKSSENLRSTLAADEDCSVDDLFEIIGHIRKHDGNRLEVEAYTDETAAVETASAD